MQKVKIQPHKHDTEVKITSIKSDILSQKDQISAHFVINIVFVSVQPIILNRQDMYVSTLVLLFTTTSVVDYFNFPYSILLSILIFRAMMIIMQQIYKG